MDDYFTLMAGSWAIVMVISLISYAVCSYLLSRIFEKAGVEGWKAWIPYYNIWIMLELGDQKGWYIFLNFIPFAGSLIFVVFLIMAYLNIGKKLGKEGIFVLWAIFLSPVWYAILAFDKSTWSGQGKPVMANATGTPQYMAPTQPVAPTEPASPESTNQPTQNL